MDDNLDTTQFIWTEFNYEIGSRGDFIPPPHPELHRDCKLGGQRRGVNRPAVMELYRDRFFIRLNRSSNTYTN